jgi:FMN-dependent NADH-azoreductase
MEKLLYIDSCIREEVSRTKKIATPIINKLKERYDVETLVINELNLTIVKKDLVNKRTNGIIDPEVLSWANKVSKADRIVIAAPFWDMSIPAALKSFIELCSIINVTFASDDKTCFGICNCKKLLYITTRGMNIKTNSELDQATPYLKAISYLWGLGEVSVVSAYNLDYSNEEEVEEKIKKAINEGLEIAKEF